MLNSRNSSFLQQGERAISKTLSCSCRIFLPPHRVRHAQNNNKHPKDKKKIAQKGNTLFTTAAGVHVPSTGKWWFLETWECSEGAAELHLQDIKYQLRVERFFIMRCLNRTSGLQLPCPVITIGTKPPLFLTAKTHNSWVQCNFFSAFIRSSSDTTWAYDTGLPCHPTANQLLYLLGKLFSVLATLFQSRALLFWCCPERQLLSPSCGGSPSETLFRLQRRSYSRKLVFVSKVSKSSEFWLGTTKGKETLRRQRHKLCVCFPL